MAPDPKSLGQTTQERGDPSAKRLDLDEPTTAPLQDATMEEGNAEGETSTGGAIASTPEASENISNIAKRAGFPEEDRVEADDSKGTGIPPGSAGAGKSSTQRPPT